MDFRLALVFSSLLFILAACNFGTETVRLRASASSLTESATTQVETSQLEKFSLYQILGRLENDEFVMILAGEQMLAKAIDLKIPQNLRPAAILDWLEYEAPVSQGKIRLVGETIEGSYLNKTSTQTFKELQTRFQQSPYSFLKRYLTDIRIAQLINERPKTIANKSERVLGWIWGTEYEQLSNMVTPAAIYCGEDSSNFDLCSPGNAKTQTDLQPKGYRSIRAQGFERAIGGGYWDGEVLNKDEKRPLVWTKAWREELAPRWDAWFRNYKKLGGELDWIFFDLEEDMPAWSSRLGTEESLQAIASDPRFASLESIIGWLFQTPAEFLAIRYKPFNPRVKLWDAWQRGMTGQDLNFLINIARRYFPLVKGADYNRTVKAPGIYASGSSQSRSFNLLGSGTAVGEYSSFAAYGGFRPIYFAMDEGTPRERGPKNVIYKNTHFPPTAEEEWAAFSTHLFAYRSAQAANRNKSFVFISNKNMNSPEESPNRQSKSSNLLYQSDLWFELIFQAYAHGFEVMNWNSERKAEHPALVNTAIREVQRIFKTGAVIPSVADPSNWDQPYIATRVDVGGRFVWRISLNPTLTHTLSEIGGRVAIRFSDGSTFELNNASVEKESISKLGYWVYQY